MRRHFADVVQYRHGGPGDDSIADLRRPSGVVTVHYVGPRTTRTKRNGTVSRTVAGHKVAVHARVKIPRRPPHHPTRTKSIYPNRTKYRAAALTTAPLLGGVSAGAYADKHPKLLVTPRVLAARGWRKPPASFYR